MSVRTLRQTLRRDWLPERKTGCPTEQSKRWPNRASTRDGKQQYAGLGPYPTVMAAEAREKAREYRKVVIEGRDPRIAGSNSAKPTFAVAVELADHQMVWRNEKHWAQWIMTLGDAYCSSLRFMRVSDIETGDVLKVLKPVWLSKPETAIRLRGRIERVLSYAKVKGWRAGENPAQWRNHLDALLPKQRKLVSSGHHAAMPYPLVSTFVERLRNAEALAARALEFVILTVARTGEALNAKWQEIDLEQAIWTVPAGRMKAGRRHEVPCRRARWHF